MSVGCFCVCGSKAGDWGESEETGASVCCRDCLCVMVQESAAPWAFIRVKT